MFGGRSYTTPTYYGAPGARPSAGSVVYPEDLPVSGCRFLLALLSRLALNALMPNPVKGYRKTNHP